MPTLEIKPTQPWLIAQPGNVAEITGQFGGADQLRNTVLYRQTTLTKHLRRTRDLLFHDTVAPHLAAYAPEASAAQQRDYLTHLHQTLNAPSHPIRNRLLRLTADSPDLLAIIKQEGKV